MQMPRINWGQPIHAVYTDHQFSNSTSHSIQHTVRYTRPTVATFSSISTIKPPPSIPHHPHSPLQQPSNVRCGFGYLQVWIIAAFAHTSYVQLAMHAIQDGTLYLSPTDPDYSPHLQPLCCASSINDAFGTVGHCLSLQHKEGLASAITRFLLW